MKDYYLILRLKVTASDKEIKEAYDNLSLIFHPYLNLGDRVFKDKFQEIREAFEVLSDPIKRKEYDLKFEISPKEQASNYVNDEKLGDAIEALYQKVKWKDKNEVKIKELKSWLDKALSDRRISQVQLQGNEEQKIKIIESVIGLYKFLDNDSISKYSGQLIELAKPHKRLIDAIGKVTNEEQREKTIDAIGYTFKIVFGLTIVCFIAYAFFFDDNSTSSKRTYVPKVVIDEEPEVVPRINPAIMPKITKFSGNQLKTGDSPYNDYFGIGVYDKAYQNRLEVKNGQTLDAIICLTDVNTNSTIRNEYIRAGESFVLTSIPDGTYYLRTFYGKDWNPEAAMFDNKLKGFFDNEFGFSTSDKLEDWIVMSQTDKEFTIYSVTLYPVKDGNMETRSITAEDFFKK